MPSNKNIFNKCTKTSPCLDKEKKPTPTNGKLASKYGIKEKTVSAVFNGKIKVACNEF